MRAHNALISWTIRWDQTVLRHKLIMNTNNKQHYFLQLFVFTIHYNNYITIIILYCRYMFPVVATTTTEPVRPLVSVHSSVVPTAAIASVEPHSTEQINRIHPTGACCTFFVNIALPADFFFLFLRSKVNGSLVRARDSCAHLCPFLR